MRRFLLSSKTEEKTYLTSQCIVAELGGERAEEMFAGLNSLVAETSVDRTAHLEYFCFLFSISFFACFKNLPKLIEKVGII